jgi:hypothetical protein
MVTIKHILNQKYGLRQLLQQKHLQQMDGSIKESSLGVDVEPQIRHKIQLLAKQIAENPDCIFQEVAPMEKRQQDYSALLEKTVSVLEPLDSRSRPGHILLDFHCPHFWTVKNWKGISVRNLAENPQMLEKALWANLKLHTTPYASEIRRTLVMVAGISNVTKYRAPMAKAIVQHFGAKTILDPCIGWGGRMIGSLSAEVDCKYFGSDPCQKTFQSLQNILNDLPKQARDRAHISNKTGEDYLDELLEKGYEQFDVVLTSPPYYNLELYSSEQTQSVNTHPTWENWLAEWLEPLIHRCLLLLKEGGVSCWSAKNFKTDREYRLADEIKKIHELHGWELVQTVKVKGSARPGGGRIQNGEETRQSEEETFCFKRKV